MSMITGSMMAGVNFEKMAQPSGSIYRLSVWLYAAPIVYPHAVQRDRVGFFSSRERAEEKMREMTCIGESPEEEDVENQIWCWEIEQEPLNVLGVQSCWPLLTWNYGPEADYLGEGCSQIVPFHGRRPDECRYRIGDWVQFKTGAEIQAGIISGLPMTPERAVAFRERGRQNPLHSLPNAQGEVKEIFLQPDQSDDTYKIMYDWNADMDTEAQEYELSPLTAPLDPAYREQLEARLGMAQGYTDLIVSPDDSGLKGIYMAINTYALDRLKERYVLIYKYHTDITVSLETFTVLEGDLPGFIAEDMGTCASLKEILEFVADNGDQFRRWFDHYALGLGVEKEAP